MRHLSSKKHIQTLDTTIQNVLLEPAPEPIPEILAPPQIQDFALEPAHEIRIAFIYNSCYETKCRSRL